MPAEWPPAGAPATVALSVDMDAPADYARFYRASGLPAEALSSEFFYDEALPPLLDLLAGLDLRATFFAIGRDARSSAGAAWLRRLAEAGHEVANHTETHPIAWRRLTRAEKAREIDQAHEVLSAAAGRPVAGFRAPAFDLDRETLDLLLERGYLYDSSLFPSLALVPMKGVARLAARRWHVGLGRLRDGFAPRGPHVWYRLNGRLRRSGRATGGPCLVELPLSVVSWARWPFYGTITQHWGVRVFSWSLGRLRRGALPIHYSLHAQELAPTPAEVPGYASTPDERREVLRDSLLQLVHGSRCRTLAELAGEVAARAAGQTL